MVLSSSPLVITSPFGVTAYSPFVWRAADVVYTFYSRVVANATREGREGGVAWMSDGEDINDTMSNAGRIWGRRRDV